MAYKKDIPAATDKLSVSQGDIQGNFQAIDNAVTAIDTGTGFAHDHISLAGLTNVGKHKKLTFTDQSADIPGAPSSPELVMYNNAGQLSIKNSSSDITPIGKVSNNANQGFAYPFSAGKYVYKWGKATLSAGAAFITLPTGASIPVFATGNPTMVQLTLDVADFKYTIYYDQSSTGSLGGGTKIYCKAYDKQVTSVQATEDVTVYFWCFGTTT